MQINLKRALKLRRALEAHTKTFSLPSSLNLPVLSEAARYPTDFMLSGQEAMMKSVDQAIAVSAILSKLRTDILKANVSGGVEDLIAEIASIDRQIAVLKPLSEASSFASDGVVLAQEVEIAIQAIKTPDATVRAYGGKTPRDIAVNLVTQKMRDDARAQIAVLRRTREDVDDERTAANARVRIEIGDDQAELLRELGLI